MVVRHYAKGVNIEAAIGGSNPSCIPAFWDRTGRAFPAFGERTGRAFPGLGCRITVKESKGLVSEALIHMAQVVQTTLVELIHMAQVVQTKLE